MEPVLYFSALIIVSVGSFWLSGVLYGLLHRPAIYFPLTLASKMAICAVFGSMVFMIGGPIFATLVFNEEMSKRADYNRWPTIFIGLLISVGCTVLIYIAAFRLAFAIFD